MSNRSEAGQGLMLLPGVQQTLKELKDRDDVAVGLVTGGASTMDTHRLERNISHRR
jgi:hypothetical protein